MLKKKTYRYVVDGVTTTSLANLRMALAVVPSITGVDFNGTSSILSVEAASNPEASVRNACAVSGVNLRGEVKNR
jgi:hypothetical protein